MNKVITIQFRNSYEPILFMKLVNANEPLTRKQICFDTGIAWSTAFDNLTKLSERKLVFKYKSKSNGKIGRPQVKWIIPISLKNLLSQNFFTFEIQQ